MKDLVQIGKVLKTHGISGEVLIKLDIGKALKNISEPVFLEFDGIQVPFFILSNRNNLEGECRIMFEDFQNKEKAEKLVGKTISAQRSNLKINENENYHNELIGFDVFDNNFGYIGKILYIQQGAQDLLIVQNEEDEIYIPFVEEFLVEIITSEKKIIVSTPDGLIDLNKN